MAEVERFKKKGCRIVRLEVRIAKHPAQKLYQHLGYAITQRLPQYYFNGGDGLLMLKALE